MKKRLKIIIIVTATVLAIAAAILLVRYSRPGKIEPGLMAPEIAAEPDAAAVRATVETETEYYEAVGTVRPRTETRIESQIAAQVADVPVRAGDKVKKGDTLVILDNRQYAARASQARQALNTAITQREQARQALNSAEAAFEEAKAAYERIKNYYASQAATEQELEQAESRFLQARAGIERARQGLEGSGAGIRQAEEMVREAEVSLGYAKVEAPADGEVLKRLIEPGDLALPGKPLIQLKTADALQLDAYVREGLIGKVKPGTTLSAVITTLDRTVEATVEEVVPYADPKTRTFLVQAILPPIEGVFPGMYGKLLIPYRTVEVILIPREAVYEIGQLELVMVKTKAGYDKRYVKTGRIYGDRVEVLSGLSGDETVLIGGSEHVRK